MDILIVHPNFPGQFRRLAPALQRDGHRVVGVGDRGWRGKEPPVPGIPVLTYELPEDDASGVHPYARNYHHAVRRGQAVADLLLEHKRQGFEPDIIFAHPGWGDAFFLKDLFPLTPVVGIFEYYYHVRGADVGFDPEFPANFDDIFRVRALNATQLMALESCDHGFCPTEWQRSRFPKAYQPQLDVIHDGIDTTVAAPDPHATFTVPGTELTLRAGEEVLTFVSRYLEPYRGYHMFVRALPQILHQRPQCRVLIVGAEGDGYGKKAPTGETWKQYYWREVKNEIDPARVHFTGPLPYEQFLRVLQVSRVHVYLTYPFVLSWSILEALSVGCLVVGSQTPPVEEVIRHGENGLLVPFFRPDHLAQTVVAALAEPDAYQPLRHAARETVVSKYDFAKICYPRFLCYLHSA